MDQIIHGLLFVWLYVLYRFDKINISYIPLIIMKRKSFLLLLQNRDVY